MPETIRDYLIRRTRWLRALTFGAWLLFGLSIAFDRVGRNPWPLSFVGFAVLFGAVLALLFLVRCPKCGKPFREFSRFGFGVGNRPQVDSCPHCGVNLDEPMPEKGELVS